MMSDITYPPSFRITKLYQRKSANGSTYFGGRLGFAKIVLVKSQKETSENGDSVWSLLVSELPKLEAQPSDQPQRDVARLGNGGTT